MAATVYLFLFAISFVSGIYFHDDEEESPLKMQPKLSNHQRLYQFPPQKSEVNQFLLEDCLRNNSYFQLYKCYQYYKSIKEDRKPKFESILVKDNSRKFTQEILNENNKQINKPESYINSILDEDKRDTSNFNTSDKVLNSTWIQIKDPRKTPNTLKSEIPNKVEEIDEFITYIKEFKATGDGANLSIAEEKENNTAIDGLNMEEETTTGIQQQTITMTVISDAVTSGQREEETTITGESSVVIFTKNVSGEKTTAKQDLNDTEEINQDKNANTHVQMKTTGVSSSGIVEKSTTADLPTDSAKLEFKTMIENRTVNEADSEVTTEKGTEDIASITEQNLLTENLSTSKSTEPENLNNDTTLSMLFTDPTKSQSISVSDADISPSTETESTTSSSTAMVSSVSVTESPEYTTESSDRGFTSTMVTHSESSTDDYVTKSIPIIHEHTINIRSIKIAKIVLSVLLLITGLIAVVMLAVYLFRVRRGAVQYDQLTLLP